MQKKSILILITIIFIIVALGISKFTGHIISEPNKTKTFDGNPYYLVWNDEFDGTILNQSKWKTPTWQRLPNNLMTQNALSVTDGNLVLKAYEENNMYYTGSANTGGKMELTYGYYEARIKFAESRGHWFTYWLDSKNQSIVGNGGRDGVEIDIAEKPKLGGSIYNVFHWDGYGADHKSIYNENIFPEIEEGFHTFGLLWTSTKYEFYYDGQKIWTVDENTPNGPGICQVPLYLILSDGVQEDWAGPVSEAVLPDYTYVDYVRVYHQDQNVISNTKICQESDWAKSYLLCMPNNTKIVKFTKINNCTNGVNYLAEKTISCNYTTPILNCTSFNYSEWSSCNSEGKKTREILNSYPENCFNGNFSLIENCTNFTEIIAAENNSINYTGNNELPENKIYENSTTEQELLKNTTPGESNKVKTATQLLKNSSTKSLILLLIVILAFITEIMYIIKHHRQSTYS
jgi:beta-glucanase (GH16 family)